MTQATPILPLSPELQTVTLSRPLKQGEREITEIQIRQPNAGELRGVSLLMLVQMQPEALFTVLPRIGTPVLTTAMLHQLTPSDLFKLGNAVNEFLVPKD
jgi:hypothetical protein